YRTAQSITKPLEDTVGVLRNIAEGEGDLTRRVNQSTGDELGEMGKWFNTFIVKLEGLVGRVAKSTQVVAGSSENLFSVSHQMGVGAEDMSVQANVVAAAAEQVTRNLQTVAAAAEEMPASMGEISKKPREAVTVIEDISGIIAKMHDISTTIASAVEEQTATTREIARNVSEAAIGESHVTENITSVAHAAKLTSGGAKPTQDAAGELAGM